jgi:glutamate decarboxylase
VKDQRMTALSHRARKEHLDQDLALAPRFTREAGQRVPKYRLAEGEMLPQTAYQIIHDEVMLDGNARFNLATFVGTWMDGYADRLYAETAHKNMIDKDEYPQTSEIEERCVHILADLWHVPDQADAIGTSTTGSSEGCMLGGLALKRRWQARQRERGAPTDAPNLVMGSNVQVVWEKFAAYWDVEPRYVPMEGDRFHMTAESMLPYVDENTIGVVAILGSTMDGSYEPVAEIAAALDDLQARTGIDVPIHVDAASGGFVAPFVDPDLQWDFRIPRVASIQTSGHKYGLVYPGVGWVLWRSKSLLPEDLVFYVNYLGGEMPTFALNFSRPGAQVLLQYFNFLRLGFDGYRSVQQSCRDVAMRLSSAIADTGRYRLLTRGDELPVFAFTLADDVDGYTVFDVSDRLRQRGWLVPAYTFPKNREDLSVIRVVCRNGFSHDLADLFLADVVRSTEYLDRLAAPLPTHGVTPGFSH